MGNAVFLGELVVAALEHVVVRGAERYAPRRPPVAETLALGRHTGLPSYASYSSKAARLRRVLRTILSLRRQPLPFGAVTGEVPSPSESRLRRWPLNDSEWAENRDP